MYQLTIQTGNQAWPFLFKDKEKAEAAHAAIQEVHTLVGGPMRECVVTDEFGRIGKFTSVQGVIFEDMDQSLFANIALAIHQQHVQLKFQDIARKDPVLMQAARQQQGPGVITPMGMNGAGGFRN